MIQRAGAVLLAVLAAVALTGRPAWSGGVVAKADEGRLTFGVQTATAKKVDNRPAFGYSATAGAAITDYVAVLNYGMQPLTVKLYASDAFNTGTGGFDLLTADKTANDVGAWTKLSKNSVTVPARGTTIVPFGLTVPTTATPGDHAGGIVASITTQSVDAAGRRIDVEQRVGMRVYLRVPGALVSKLRIVAASAAYKGTLNPFGHGRVTMSYTVRNEGNVRLAARQAVRLGNVFGTSLRGNGFEALPELLPGNEYTVTVPIAQVLPALRSTVTVTVDPAPIPGATNPRGDPVSVRATFWAIPWTLLAILGLLIVGAAVFSVVRRMRRPAPPRPRGRKVPVAVALVVLAGTVLAGVPAHRADAAPPTGTLLIDPFDGHDTSRNSIITSGPCPGGDYIIAKMTGPGFPAAGQVVQANTPISQYATTASGGLVIPLLQTFQVFAGMQNPPARLSGVYTLKVTCIEKLKFTTSLGDFVGTIKFTSPTAYSFQGQRPSPSPLASASTAPPVQEDFPTAAPNSPGVPDLAGSGSTGDDGGLMAAAGIFALVAAVIGGLLYFRRRPLDPQ